MPMMSEYDPYFNCVWCGDSVHVCDHSKHLCDEKKRWMKKHEYIEYVASNESVWRIPLKFIREHYLQNYPNLKDWGYDEDDPSNDLLLDYFRNYMEFDDFKYEFKQIHPGKKFSIKDDLESFSYFDDQSRLEIVSDI